MRFILKLGESVDFLPAIGTYCRKRRICKGRDLPDVVEIKSYLIPKVLLPLEVVAIPETIAGYRSEVNKDNFIIDTSTQHSIKAMQQLYANAPEKLISK